MKKIKHLMPLQKKLEKMRQFLYSEGERTDTRDEQHKGEGNSREYKCKTIDTHTLHINGLTIKHVWETNSWDYGGAYGAGGSADGARIIVTLKGSEKELYRAGRSEGSMNIGGGGSTSENAKPWKVITNDLNKTQKEKFWSIIK